MKILVLQENKGDLMDKQELLDRLNNLNKRLLDIGRCL